MRFLDCPRCGDPIDTNKTILCKNPDCQTVVAPVANTLLREVMREATDALVLELAKVVLDKQTREEFCGRMNQHIREGGFWIGADKKPVLRQKIRSAGLANPGTSTETQLLEGLGKDAEAILRGLLLSDQEGHTPPKLRLVKTAADLDER